MIYAIGCIVVYFLHVLLKLSWMMTLFLGVYTFGAVYLHKKLYLNIQANKERFQEVSLYLDTVLYAFVKEEKIDQAIQDVAYTLPNGKMRRLVEAAAEYINITFDKSGVVEEALKKIEEEYPCKRMRDVHQFMIHVESYGGEIEKTVALLLADKSRWEKRIKGAMVHRTKQMTDVILSVIVSLFISGMVGYLPVETIDISSMTFIQVCAFLVIVIDDFIIYRAQNYLNVDWIQMQLTQEEEYYVQKIERFYQYDEKKEKKLSYVLGGIGTVAVIIGVVLKNEWFACVMMGITLFMFNQHIIGRWLEKKNLTKEIKYAFPNWLLDLVLLLQSENVHVALQKSKAHVPGVLRKDLYFLTERLEMEPESSAPYHMFLQEFAIPEVHSAMGILYALSIGNSGNADKQIGELVEKNLELMDATETELLVASSNGMYVLFFLPVVVASFKLVADMAVMMLYFVQIPVI